MLCLASVDALRELRPKGISPVLLSWGGEGMSPAVSKLPESSVPSVGGGLKHII